MNKFSFVIIVIGFFVVTTYNACSAPSSTIFVKGTEITNPMSSTSNMILSAACGVINRCHPEVSISKCSTGLLTVPGMNAPLGLSSKYDTLASIARDEISGLLVGDSPAARVCYGSIDALDCSDPRVQSAYDSQSSTPFSGAVNMVSAQYCAEAFTPVAQYTCSTQVFLRGVANAPNAPAISQSGITYSVSPALPAGLSLDSKSGEISGTPTTTTPMTSYTITAKNDFGSAESTIHIKTADGFFVDSFTDTNDTAPGDKICNTTNGTCTLRAALAEANADTSKIYSIVMGKGTLNLSAPLQLSSSVEIYGGCPGPTVIDGQTTQTIFETKASNITISMQSLTLQHGYAGPSGAGGGAVSGGFNQGQTFKGTELIFTSNVSDATGTGGGAVQWGPNSSFFCTDCIFDSNRAAHDGGALHLSGGTNQIQRSLFVNNSAQGAGAIFSTGSDDTYTNCTFYSNRSSSNPGAIYLNATSGNIRFVNDTFVNNSAAGPLSTGAIDSNGVAAIFANTLLSNNTGSRGNCSLTVNSLGGNIASPSSSYCSFGGASDLTQAPLLGPLQNNGGFSSTLSLLTGSPGVGNGVASNCPAVDQRNFSRPSANAPCDTGAFESPQ